VDLWFVRNGRDGYTLPVMVAENLLAALQRYWGYETFRPMQERIVSSLFAGRDACVVMPTGGGKSLCYQLPAAMSAGRTVLVVSPLIALMQDQVAQLTQMGIAAGLLNSSLRRPEQSRVMQKAAAGDYRLLYLSPERLTLPETVSWLQRVPLAFFVIDEAHCISEWGHEFRPEYRQLSSLRSKFPDRPIAAFTASATRRVRHDIIDQLQLRDPAKFIASFHRPNLRYLVKECLGGSQEELLLRAMGNYPDGNIIVYAPTIARVGETVRLLRENGVESVAYHGQMDHETRQRNQERWMSDEVRVLVGTIAFGLGINKPAVRAVIHLSLPKSIEQYYQEAGRGGRDGLPADCLLLWQKRDAGLLAHFIGQLSDAAEREAAWQRYHEIRSFVESDHCRHRRICVHFGEVPKWDSCGACDVCSDMPAWLLEDVSPARKSRERAGDKRRKPLAAVAVPISRPGRVSAVRLVAAGAAAPVDEGLRERLREWRRVVARERKVPAFVVMHDTSLDDLCRKRPASARELRQVHGFGEKKTAEYGSQILEVLREFRRHLG
jgi:ATP-dependent DNA helicase RecQ